MCKSFTTYLNPFRALIIEVGGSLKEIATLKNADGKFMQLRMKSRILDRKAEIKDAATGRVVASIHRDLWNTREIVFDKKSYLVEIQPGVDVAISI
jgi:hypothetical protein